MADRPLDSVDICLPEENTSSSPPPSSSLPQQDQLVEPHRRRRERDFRERREEIDLGSPSNRRSPLLPPPYRDRRHSPPQKRYRRDDSGYDGRRGGYGPPDRRFGNDYGGGYDREMGYGDERPHGRFMGRYQDINIGNSSSVIVPLPNTIFKRGQETSQSAVINQWANFKVVDTVEEIVGPDCFDRIKQTFLGPIIKASANKLAFSAKIVHYLLCRQIVTKKKKELWFCFGGQPMRFSLREFHMVTGLPCGDEKKTPGDDDRNLFDWPSLKERHSLGDITDLLRQTTHQDERFALGMLMIIEGIFLQKYKNYTFPASNAEKARDVTSLMTYPWGRDAYEILLKSVQKVKKTTYLSKPKYDLHGFPMALHLWVLASVPAMQAAFSRLDNNAPRNGIICQLYSYTKSPTMAEIKTVESSEEVSVTYILSPLGEDAENSISSLEDANDDNLELIADVLRTGYRITTSDWDHGSIDLCKIQDDMDHRARIRTLIEKVAPSQMQTREDSIIIMKKIENLYRMVEDGFKKIDHRLTILEHNINFKNEKERCDEELLVPSNKSPTPQGNLEDVEHIENMDYTHNSPTNPSDGRCDEELIPPSNNSPANSSDARCDEELLPPSNNSPAHQQNLGVSGGKRIEEKTSNTKEYSLREQTQKEKEMKHIKQQNFRICYKRRENKPKEPAATESVKDYSFSQVMKTVESYSEKVFPLICGVDVPREFFHKLATPHQMLQGDDMKVLADTLWRRKNSSHIAQGIVVVDHVLPILLADEYVMFQSQCLQWSIKWDRVIPKLLLLDTVTLNHVWVQHSKTIYFPMRWEDPNHWVGVSINITSSSIEVLDPFVDKTSEEQVKKHMDPIATILPYILRDANQAISLPIKDRYNICSAKTVPLKPFTWTRLSGTSYQQVSSNETDSGVVALMLIEMHINTCGSTMGPITHEDITAARRRYVVDVFDSQYLKHK